MKTVTHISFYLPKLSAEFSSLNSGEYNLLDMDKLKEYGEMIILKKTDIFN